MSLMDWPRLLAEAARIGVPPDAFWRMSLREWRLLVSDNRAMERGELEALLSLYPDRRET
jgi:uncharacterized phage protein (TIGR02216 family)